MQICSTYLYTIEYGADESASNWHHHIRYIIITIH